MADELIGLWSVVVYSKQLLVVLNIKSYKQLINNNYRLQTTDHKQNYMRALYFILMLAFSTPQQSNNFSQLHALTGGTWVMGSANGRVCERWVKQSDNLLTNRSFKVKGNDTTWQESVRLLNEGSKVTYWSRVANENEGKEVPFILTEAKDNRFTFSNPQHDFPQRIIYELVNKDSLHAWIEGNTGGKNLVLNNYYRRERP